MSLTSRAGQWIEHERIRSIAAVTFHISIALIVTLVNKACLNVAPLPCALLFIQSLTSVSLLTLGDKLGICTVRNLSNDQWRRIALYLLARASSQVLKLYCLRYVDAAFYQVVRGLLIPFTALLSFLLLVGWRISRLALCGCAVIVLGFLTGIEGETVTSTPSIGLALGVLSSLATAAESVFVKRVLNRTDMGLLDTACAAATINMPLSAALSLMSREGDTLRLMVFSEAVTLRKVATAYFGSSLVTFVLALATLLQISITSPLTHMISTAFRGVLQAGVAVAVFRTEHLGMSRTTSLGIIVAGTALYSYGKDRELKSRAMQAVEADAGLMQHSPSTTGADEYELVNRDETSVELNRPLTANDRDIGAGDIEKRSS